MPPLAQTRCTPEEYLALERTASHKNEYVNGRIREMTAESRRHNLITGNIFGELRAQLRGRSCEVHVADMRVKVTATGLYTYPDVVALCGEPRLEDAYVDTLLNPSLIVEVLSESTERYDRGEKWAHYRRLDSLREYVLVSQDKVRAERYLRRDGELWVFSDVDDPDGSLPLESIGCTLSLRDVYERVEFADETA